MSNHFAFGMISFHSVSSTNFEYRWQKYPKSFPFSTRKLGKFWDVSWTFLKLPVHPGRLLSENCIYSVIRGIRLDYKLLVEVRTRMGEEINEFLTLVHPFSHSSDQQNLTFFFNKAVIGAVIVKKWGMIPPIPRRRFYYSPNFRHGSWLWDVQNGFDLIRIDV